MNRYSYLLRRRRCQGRHLPLRRCVFFQIHIGTFYVAFSVDRRNWLFIKKRYAKIITPLDDTSPFGAQFFYLNWFFCNSDWRFKIVKKTNCDSVPVGIFEKRKIACVDTFWRGIWICKRNYKNWPVNKKVQDVKPRDQFFEFSFHKNTSWSTSMNRIWDIYIQRVSMRSFPQTHRFKPSFLDQLGYVLP